MTSHSNIIIKTISTILFCTIIFFHFNSFSQLSRGGFPYSFTNDRTKYKNDIAEFLLPAVDVNALQKEDAVTDKYKDIPWRFGYNIPVRLSLNNAGSWETLEKGKLWRLKLVSEGAISINLTFDDYYLPQGAELFIYNESRSMVLGAFTAQNNKSDHQFGTAPVQGDRIILEYFEPFDVAFQGSLSIEKVTHAYRDIITYTEAKGFGGSQPCNNNVICTIADAWRNAIRSVAMVIANGNTICTGALINNTCNDETPYFLLANHCLTSSPSTWIFRFNWSSPTCTPTLNGPTTYTISGAVLKAKSDYTDFALLELTEQPPATYNVWYAGWDKTGAIPSSTATIHHPEGDVKKITIDNDSAVYSTIPWVSKVWRVVWDYGTTEKGSSGASLFDSNERIIGQLYGGYATCNNMDSADYFGRLDVSWDYDTLATAQLKTWLDKCNTGDSILNGYNPVILKTDAALSAIVQPSNDYSSCNLSLSPILLIKNKGTDTLSSLKISYRIDTHAVQLYQWKGSLENNSSVNISLPVQLMDTATHTLTVFTSFPNDTSDMNTSNDTLKTTFYIFNPTVYAVPLSEGFESSVFPPTDWTINNPDNNKTWVKTTDVSGFSNSTACIMFDNFSMNSTGKSDYVISPYFDFTSVTPSLLLSFSYAYSRYDNIKNDSLIISLSSDCDQVWKRMYAKGGESLSTTNDTNIIPFIPIKTEWRNDTINISSFIGQNKVNIAFENKSGYGNNLYIDDINIFTQPNTIKETIQDNTISIFPNPSNGLFFLQSDNFSEIKKIRVLTTLGQIVWQTTSPSLNRPIDLSNTTEGVYFIEITTIDNVIMQKILIFNY